MLKCSIKFLNLTFFTRIHSRKTFFSIIGLAIAISSSWRYIHRLGSLRMMWEVRALPGDVLDILPCRAASISRGEDIEYWLS